MAESIIGVPVSSLYTKKIYSQTMKHTRSHMLQWGRAKCTCSRPDPIVSSPCSPSAIVLLVPVLSSSLPLPPSLPPDPNHPFPFLAQHVSFYPLFTGCKSFHHAPHHSLSFPSGLTQRRSLCIALPLAMFWLLSALPVRPLLYLPSFLLSVPPSYQFVSPISLVFFTICLHNRWNEANLNT